jgi:uncharacterized protein
MQDSAAMPFSDLLGRVVALPIRRFGPPGAFLGLDPLDASPNAPVVLLPGGEIPEGALEGQDLKVCIYLDSEGRPIATMRTPALEIGDVTFLDVTDITDFGAFFAWGLPRDIFVPFAEQTRSIAKGERHPIGLYVDGTGRLAGTMKVSEMLRVDESVLDRELALDEWIEGEAWRNEPDIGLFVILEKFFTGVVPASEPHTLVRGETARFRVSNLLPDGKVELSLRGHAHEELEKDALKILTVMTSRRPPRIGDNSTPDEIREAFGISKKAFKRAVGRLLKTQRVTLDDDGFLRVRQR